MKTSKTSRLITALQKGDKLTAAQIQRRFGFVSPNSASAAVSHLETKSGYRVIREQSNSGSVRYGLAR